MKKIQVQKIDSFTGHSDSVYTLENSVNKGCFYSAGGDGIVVEWKLDIPDIGKPIAKVHNSIYAIALENSKNLLWIGHNFDGIHVIDPISKEAVSSIKLNKTAIFDIKFLNNLAFVAGGDGVLSIIEIKSCKLIKQQKVAEKSLRSMAINPTRNELAIGCSDDTIKIINLDTFEIKYQLIGHKNSVFCVCYSPNFKMLVSGSRDAKLILWDVDSDYSKETLINAHLFTINDITFNFDGTIFATCSTDKSIKIWDFSTLILLKVIDKGRYVSHGTSINKLLWTNHQNQLLSCSDDRTISSWILS